MDMDADIVGINFTQEEINKEILKQAIKATFEQRNSMEDLENIDKIINIIEKDKTLIYSWKDYQAKHLYAKNIKYDDVIKDIRSINNEIN